MDFVMDALANSRRLKCLTCVDDFTKECLTILFMPGKRLMTGETGNMKKKQPT